MPKKNGSDGLMADGGLITTGNPHEDAMHFAQGLLMSSPSHPVTSKN